MLKYVKDRLRGAITKTDKYTGTDNTRLAKNGFWGVLPNIIGSFVSLGLTALYANFLPKETLGTFKFILALGGSLGFLTLTGMNSAVTQAVTRGVKGTLKYSVNLQIRWNSLYAVAALLLGGYYVIQNNTTIGLGVIALGIAFPLTSALNTYGAFYAGRRDFRATSLYAAATNIAYGVIMGTIIIFTKAVFLILIAHSIGLLVPVIIAYRLALKHDRFTLAADERRSLRHFGQHLSLINVFASISKNIDRIALFHFAGPVTLATYSIANAVPERAKGLLASAFPSVLPSLAKRDIKTIRASFYIRLGQGFFLGTLAAAAYWLLAPTLFALVAPKYLESIHYSRWLSLSLPLVLPYLYSTNALVGQKMTRGLYIQSWTTHIVRIAAIPLAVSFFGIWGLVVGMLLLQFFGLLTNVAAWELESCRLQS